MTLSTQVNSIEGQLKRANADNSGTLETQIKFSDGIPQTTAAKGGLVLARPASR